MEKHKFKNRIIITLNILALTFYSNFLLGQITRQQILANAKPFATFTWTASTSHEARPKIVGSRYVSLADSSRAAVSNIGAYFSNDSLLDHTLGNAINYVTPQVENPTTNMLSDKVNWMLVSGNFIAQGGE